MNFKIVVRAQSTFKTSLSATSLNSSALAIFVLGLPRCIGRQEFFKSLYQIGFVAEECLDFRLHLFQGLASNVIGK